MDEECSVNGCHDPIKALGLCNKHWLRQWRHGSLETNFTLKEDHPQWKGTEASYRAKHHRVYRVRGHASDYPCIWDDGTCEGQMGWANMTGDYDDVWDFAPACDKHHKAFDKSRREGALV